MCRVRSTPRWRLERRAASRVSASYVSARRRPGSERLEGDGERTNTAKLRSSQSGTLVRPAVGPLDRWRELGRSFRQARVPRAAAPIADHLGSLHTPALTSPLSAVHSSGHQSSHVASPRTHDDASSYNSVARAGSCRHGTCGSPPGALIWGVVVRTRSLAARGSTSSGRHSGGETHGRDYTRTAPG